MADNDVLLVSEWGDLTVAQLKEELVSRGLETTGRKSELVSRLEANDREILNAQNQEEEEAPPNEEAPNEEEENGDDLVVWADDDTAPAEEDKLVLDEDNEEDTAAAPSSQPAEEDKPKDIPEDKAAKEETRADAAKEKDSFFVTWHGEKVAVPFKDEIQKDIKRCVKQQNIIMYPAEIADIYSEPIKPFVEKAINVSMELDETVLGQPIKGYLRLKFGSSALAAEAMEILRNYKPEDREITLEHFGENDSEGHVLSKVKSKDSGHKDPLLHRLMFVSNLPNETTEETLRTLFQDALRVIIPVKEEATERIGYAYVEYASAAEVSEAVERHKELELGEQKLYIIKSMTERKEAFGLLRDSLRKYWLEQIKSLEGVKAKPHNKSVRELQELETKLTQLKKRICKDNKKRLELRLPVPENELFQIPEGESDKEEAESSKEKEKDRSLSSSRKDSRLSDRRRTPPRRHYSPSRSRSSYRYASRGSSSYRGGPPGMPPRTDHLMSQLHELVGALSDMGGNRSGRGGYYESSRGGGRGSSGYGGGSGYGRDYPGSSSRYGSKRPSDMDYGGDRKRRMDDYPGYEGRSGGGYGSYSSHRGSGYHY